MARYVAIFLLGGLFGTGFGVAVGFFTFPYVFPPPEAAETLSETDRDILVARGNFIHANPADPIHYGSGGVEIYENVVFLAEDFEVGPGPDYHVYLVPKPEIRASADLGDAMYIDLGKLRAFKGSQRYEIPDGVDLANYPSVLIWCKRFGVLISPADLDFAS